MKNRIKILRKEKKITVKELAKELNISQSMLSNYENGNSYPRNPDIWKQLASIFEVDEAYVMGVSDIPVLKNSSNNIKLYREQKNLSIKDLSNLTSIPEKELLKYENGDSNPDNKEVWNIISEALSIPISFLFDPEKEKLSDKLDVTNIEMDKLLRKDTIIKNISNVDYQKFNQLSEIHNLVSELITIEINDDNSDFSYLQNLITDVLTYSILLAKESKLREETNTTKQRLLEKELFKDSSRIDANKLRSEIYARLGSIFS